MSDFIDAETVQSEINNLNNRIRFLEEHNAELERLVRMKLEGSHSPKEYQKWQEEARRVLHDSGI